MRVLSLAAAVTALGTMGTGTCCCTYILPPPVGAQPTVCAGCRSQHGPPESLNRRSKSPTTRRISANDGTSPKNISPRMAS